MKVKCDFCGSMYEDTQNSCPGCGATNTQVRRSTPDQPATVEDLKAWYESKGLPSYETTRFFIGIDYSGPRAFGIYKDPYNGNFVVYKNKDNGSRAVRYEGTDEAYAVNELFMRLKQEIVEQKARNASRGVSPYYSKNGAGRTQRRSVGSGLTKIIATIFVINIIASLSVGALMNRSYHNGVPDQGYYVVDREPYYSMGRSQAYENWAHYNLQSGEWESVGTSSIPAELEKRKTAKKYFWTQGYMQEYDFTDFQTSRLYYEYIYSDGYAAKGYYEYEGNDYYHLDSFDTSSWYYYNDDSWEPVDYDSLPDPLKFEYDARDFYYYPAWDSSTQISDFSETTYYQDYEREQEEVSRSYDDDDDDDDDSWNSYDSSDYSWDSGSDSWDSGSTDWGSDW
ncbi:MAG: hypothetical protein K5686_04635 [Lachnospiraceae bacterium]|nr:hypothetical protein [Lachnospiraceae bacterium]